MTITRYGKCVECKIPVTRKRNFAKQVDMFTPDNPVKLDDIADQLKAWREEAILCKRHGGGES